MLLLRVFEGVKYLLLLVVKNKNQMIKSMVVGIWMKIEIFSQLSEFFK